MLLTVSTFLLSTSICMGSFPSSTPQPGRCGGEIYFYIVWSTFTHYQGHHVHKCLVIRKSSELPCVSARTPRLCGGLWEWSEVLSIQLPHGGILVLVRIKCNEQSNEWFCLWVKKIVGNKIFQYEVHHPDHTTCYLFSFGECNLHNLMYVGNFAYGLSNWRTGQRKTYSHRCHLVHPHDY